MIVVTFTFLGNEVKITTEGKRAIHPDLKNDPKLDEILALNNSIISKENNKYKESLEWCRQFCVKEFKKPRQTNFAL